MKHRFHGIFRRAGALALTASIAATLLTGCHGGSKRLAFSGQAKLDLSGEYNISFWAKNDTNRRQAEIRSEEHTV